jgi:hypothetical protein
MVRVLLSRGTRKNILNLSVRKAGTSSKTPHTKGKTRQSASFLYTLRKYKFLAGSQFDVGRNFRNKV